MDSRIILTQADFSANNIGRYVELSDLTKKVLAKQTQYEEQSAEAAALNTFLDHLTNDGFIGGKTPLIKTMVIPALAASHAELLFNIADLDGGGYPKNVMNDTEQTEQTHVLVPFEYSGRIIGFTVKATTSSELARGRVPHNLSISNSVVYPSLSLVAFVLSSGASSADRKLYNITNSNGNGYTITSKTAKLYNYNEGTYLATTTNAAPIGFLGASLNKTGGTWEVLRGDNAVYTYTSEGTPSSMTANNVNQFMSCGFNSNYDNDKASFAAIITADYINPQKMSSLKNYLDALMLALHVVEN